MLIYTEFVFVEIALRLGGARLSGSWLGLCDVAVFFILFFFLKMAARSFMAVLIWNLSAACCAFRTRPGVPCGPRASAAAKRFHSCGTMMKTKSKGDQGAFQNMNVSGYNHVAKVERFIYDDNCNSDHTAVIHGSCGRGTTATAALGMKMC